MRPSRIRLSLRCTGRLAASAALAIVLFQRGCDEAPSARVQVHGVPARVASLEVMVIALDSRSTEKVLRREGPPAGSLELMLPPEMEGPIALAGVAYDGRRCVVALGSQRQGLALRPTLELVASAYAAGRSGCSQGSRPVSTLALSPLSRPDCRVRIPLIAEVQPMQAPPGATVLLRGFAFRPGLTVTVASQASRSEWLSPGEVRVTLPTGLPPGPVSIKLVNPDTTFDQRDDLLTIASASPS
ncbi:MAG: IPT/TIG domain-containing protein [Myxococcales bacterium]|nr:IPT/TIG domain-containing protein [Myxococcales bacterium]